MRSSTLLVCAAPGHERARRFERRDALAICSIAWGRGVVIGSDWPFVPWKSGLRGRVQGLKFLTQQETDKTLWQNREALLEL
jgi:hypothetical protein